MRLVARAQQLLHAVGQGVPSTWQTLAVDVEGRGCATVAEPIGDFSNAGTRCDEQARMSVAKHVESKAGEPDAIEKGVVRSQYSSALILLRFSTLPSSSIRG